MSKQGGRLIEFNVGDPKSNQQTASKVDCSITINNKVTPPSSGQGQVPNGPEHEKRSHEKRSHEGKPEGSNRTMSPQGKGDVILNERNIEVFGRSPQILSEGFEHQNYNGHFDPRVNIAVRPKTRSVPSSTERFLVVSRQPVITSEEIENNIDFLKKLNTILTDTLTCENRKLVANMIDSSGKVILTGQDLCEIIAEMLNIDAKQVNISYVEGQIESSCFRIKILPFKEILNIKIDNQDFRSSQNEAYNVLTDTYKISLNTVYIL